MRDYETIFILNPTLEEEEAEKVNLRMQDILKSGGGELIRVEKWGKRRLAYEVKKHKKGDYILLRYQSGPEVVTELERNMKLADQVIKFMTVKLEKDMLENEAAVQKQKAEEEAKAEEARAAAEAEEAAKAAEEPAAEEAKTEEAPAEEPAAEAAPEAEAETEEAKE